MKRAVKIALAILGAVLAVAVLSASCYRDLDENDTWSRTASDFRSLEQAVKILYSRDKLSLDQLERLQSIDDFADVVAPVLEDPSVARLDGRNQSLDFDRVEFDDRVVLTVRSTIPYKKEWFWHKDPPPLAMEITIYRDREKAFQIKQLWRSE